MINSPIEAAAHAISDAKFLLFTAGAGMGVDSGLPDFRGNEGFWRAYPPLAQLGIGFADMANPSWFERDPELAWGFYGHRLNLYRQTNPHEGFAILKKWADEKPARVYTSNVDGAFQKVGIENVCEVHGSIHYLQCVVPCTDTIWSAANTQIEVDSETFRALGELPKCPNCGELLRPNICMFGDSAWRSDLSDSQLNKLDDWLDEINVNQLTIIECGAGTAISTVRDFGERLQRAGATLVRINVRESEGPSGTISIDLGAREALGQINQTMD